jgi:probable FeS assembly SUF system protein SufT
MHVASTEKKWRVLERTVPAVLIPSGDAVTLEPGFELLVTQALGDSVTVMTDKGFMARLERNVAEELGLVERRQDAIEDDPSLPLEERIQRALRGCYDPEIPVNIVDLGLVYEVKVTESLDKPGKKDVEVLFTLTAPGCGMGGVLQNEIQQKILRFPDVDRAIASVVFEPPWSRDRMTDAAKLQLNLL